VEKYPQWSPCSNVKDGQDREDEGTADVFIWVTLVFLLAESYCFTFEILPLQKHLEVILKMNQIK